MENQRGKQPQSKWRNGWSGDDHSAGKERQTQNIKKQKRPVRWASTAWSILAVGLMVSLLLAGCQGMGAAPALVRITAVGEPHDPVTIPTNTPLSPTRPRPKATLTPTITPTATATATQTPTSTPTSLPPTPTPDPYAGLYLMDLVNRTYGGGELLILKALAENSYFSRYLVAYPSDGLNIFGFMDVPKRGTAPYPVIIAVHGFVDPTRYQTLDYTAGYADSLAREGFLVIHPNLRNYPPSDSGPNLFRVGMAIDVLNLIAIVRSEGGQPGSDLEAARPDDIGLWGHSMGGGIVLRAITVDQGVKAAVLYGAMSGNEKWNYEAMNLWSGETLAPEELQASDQVLAEISPINYLDRIQAAVSIHHGGADPLVPLKWSEDLCQRLQDLRKPVVCFTYPGELHTFSGEGEQLFMQRTAEFFKWALGAN